MSMTGYLARGTGCCGVTSVDFGRYSRIVGGLSSGSRPSAGRGLTCPGCPPPRPELWAASAGSRQSPGVFATWATAEAETLATAHQTNSSLFIEEASQRAVSRILSPPSLASRRAPVDDDHSSSPAITGGVKRPTRRLRTGRPDDVSLFGLAPCGVLPATRVTTGAVRSYRTFSPLPAFALSGSGAAGLATCRWLCIFCATVFQVALTAGSPAHCPAEFGLSSLRLAERESKGDHLACCD